MNTYGQVRKDTEGHRGTRMGAEWCRGMLQCECDTETGQGGHRGHGYTYFRVHYTKGKREKTQMITEGHRFGMTCMLCMCRNLMITHRCVDMNETQRTALRDTEGHGQAYLRWHASGGNRKKQKWWHQTDHNQRPKQIQITNQKRAAPNNDHYYLQPNVVVSERGETTRRTQDMCHVSCKISHKISTTTKTTTIWQSLTKGK